MSMEQAKPLHRDLLHPANDGHPIQDAYLDFTEIWKATRGKALPSNVEVFEAGYLIGRDSKNDLIKQLNYTIGRKDGEKKMAERRERDVTLDLDRWKARDLHAENKLKSLGIE